MKTTHVAVRPAEAEGKLAAEGPSAFVGEMRQFLTFVLCREADLQCAASILLCGGDA